MGNCCKSLPTPLSPSPGQVVNLTAILDASSASVTLQWVPPMHNGDLVTSYDVRFKPVGAAHYTYKTVDQPNQFSIMLSPMDGLTPLTRYNFDVRAKIHEMGGHWCGIIQYVEWSCRLPGCFNNRIHISRNHISAFCSRDHAKQCAVEFCLFRECQERKSRVEGLEYHFCTPFHLRMAKLRNLSALLEMNGPTDQFKELCKLFRKRWAKGTCPVIQSVLQIVNPSVEECFNTYCQTLPWGQRKVEQFFHGTTLSCNILQHLMVCNESQPLEECGVCGIVENGFEENRISGRWQRHLLHLKR